MTPITRACVFDVNETLLDLKSLDPHFERAFGDVTARREWFQQLLQSAFTSTIVGTYHDFSTIGNTALSMVANRRGKDLSNAQRHDILDAAKAMPPHEDVGPALKRLQLAGIRLAALTNSPLATVESALETAGLRSMFEQVLSCDTVRRFKPAPEPYLMAARRLGVPLEETILVACHAWDTAGAMAAGCRAAFVSRPPNVLDPLFPQPDVVGNGLLDVAEQIIAQQNAESTTAL